MVSLEGLFDDWIETLRTGVDTNIANPGPFRRDYLNDGQAGRLLGDYCNWSRIDEYHPFMLDSPAPAIAAQLMQSDESRIFHEHELAKEPGTNKITPWHHEQPY